MDITRLGRHGTSYRTTLPAHLARALGLRVGDHVAWTFNTKGHGELRRLPRADELAAAAPKRK